MSAKPSTVSAFALGLVLGASAAYLIAKRQMSPPKTSLVECEAKPAEPVAQANPDDRGAASLPKELQAPEFTSEGPVKSNAFGEVLVKWKEVAGAEKYQVKVVDSKGKEVQSVKTPRTFVYVKDLPIDPNLKHTDYKLQVAILDKEKNLGPMSKPIDIYMIPLRNLHAPTIKAIVPED